MQVESRRRRVVHLDNHHPLGTPVRWKRSPRTKDELAPKTTAKLPRSRGTRSSYKRDWKIVESVALNR